MNHFLGYAVYEFLWWTGVIAAGFLFYTVAFVSLRGIYIYTTWKVFGAKPLICDDRQAGLIAQECVKDYLRQWAPENAPDGLRFEVLAPFTAWAILRYTQAWSLGEELPWIKPVELEHYKPSPDYVAWPAIT